MSLRERTDLVNQALAQIDRDFQLAMVIRSARVQALLPAGSSAEIDDLILIGICIKYETFAGDLLYSITHYSPGYNHPWVYTRSAAKILNIDITSEYTNAHDIWDYYNTLKHVNGTTKKEKMKIVQRYGLSSPDETLAFAYNAIKNLIAKFKPKASELNAINQNGNNGHQS